MKNIFSTLEEALHLLLRKPKLFVPNLMASAFYAAFELVLLFAAAGIVLDMYEVSVSVEVVEKAFFWVAFAFVVYPLVAAVDLVTYAMYPSMVVDYRRGLGVGLKKSLFDALAAWKVWASLGLFAFVLLFFMSLIIGVAAALALLYENVAFVFVGGLFAVFFVLAVMLLVFFVIPIGVIEKKGILESFRRSYRMGLQHKSEVLLLELFVLAVVFFAFLLGGVAGADGFSAGITALAVFLFLVARFFQSVLYTYVCVVNPLFYLRVSEKKG